ncbi:hypothetical protein TWF730_009885 [Orbilia blumenaviensis]|uniref:RelA/SpoT domain-containing protein n=1 Tax=Orbilia blumenaviensis TaxID=1796055 RepID=A0AAV9UVK3_9PEZI
MTELNPPNPVIDDFIKQYAESGVAVYANLTTVAMDILTKELEDIGVKHEIYDRGKQGSRGGRAKSVESARQTILRRQKFRGIPYDTLEQITADMHDLAGLRIALYYPNQLEKVGRWLETRFMIIGNQRWPEPNAGVSEIDTNEQKRVFPGYTALHFRVQLLEDDPSNSSVTEGRVLEIQLMSLLMHTWSKIYHELVYKPQEDSHIDRTDKLLLDSSNGIILVGEQLLGRVGESIGKMDEPFESQQAWELYLRRESDKYYSTSRPQNKPKNPSNSQSNIGIQSQCLSAYKAKSGNGAPRPRPRLISIEMLCESDQIKEILYKTLIKYRQNTPKGFCTNVKGSTKLSNDHDQFSLEELIRNFADSTVLANEYQKHRLPSPYAVLNKIPWHNIPVVRFKAFIVCGALRMAGDLGGIWSHAKTYQELPSTLDFSEILGPRPEKIERETIQLLNKFLDYMIRFKDYSWQSTLAIVRIGWQTLHPNRYSEYFENMEDLLDAIARDITYEEFLSGRREWATSRRVALEDLKFVHDFIYCYETSASDLEGGRNEAATPTVRLLGRSGLLTTKHTKNPALPQSEPTENLSASLEPTGLAQPLPREGGGEIYQQIHQQTYQHIWWPKYVRTTCVTTQK